MSDSIHLATSNPGTGTSRRAFLTTAATCERPRCDMRAWKKHVRMAPQYLRLALRREAEAGTAYNMVGFQTRLTWPEQRRVFRGLVPGLANAEFLRLGQVHRNTFVDAPRLLAPDLSLRERPHLFLAGQITGVEGYVESAACGHLAARAILDRIAGRPFRPPPPASALGALHRHLTGEAHPPGHEHQPSNVVFALFPPLPGRHRGKMARQAAYAERARREIATWLE
mgnify:CR=1 FL=1